MTSQRRLDGACITREQFLLREMRVVARLRQEGLPDEEVVARVAAQNLFQYPTDRTVRNIASVCVKRLNALGSPELERVIATGEPEAAAQANLYAMMRTYPLVRHFMMTVVAEHYRDFDYSLGAMEMNGWVTRVREDYDNIAGLSDSTMGKVKQVLRSGLVRCGMLRTARSAELVPVALDLDVEGGIRALVYMHRYTPDLLARVRTDYVHERQERYRSRIAELERERGGASRKEVAAIDRELRGLRAQLDEVTTFEERLHHLADQMIQIDLDDGFKVNYAKFAGVMAKVR